VHTPGTLPGPVWPPSLRLRFVANLRRLTLEISTLNTVFYIHQRKICAKIHGVIIGIILN
jgi:hypothetical protein